MHYNLTCDIKILGYTDAEEIRKKSFLKYIMKKCEPLEVATK